MLSDEADGVEREMAMLRTSNIALQLAQLLAHARDDVVELRDALGAVRAQPLGAAALQRLLRLERPEDLSRSRWG